VIQTQIGERLEIVVKEQGIPLSGDKNPVNVLQRWMQSLITPSKESCKWISLSALSFMKQ
jgi:hypothetical protein